MLRALKTLHNIEDAILVLLLVAMMLLACAQILLRNVFDDAIIWADPLLRVFVLWIGLCGAMAATRSDKHIRIDLMTRMLKPVPARIATAVSNAFAAAVCAVLAWHSFRFVRDEYQAGLTAFNDIPAWMLEAILPIGFGVMALRFAIRIFMPVDEAQP